MRGRARAGASRQPARGGGGGAGRAGTLLSFAALVHAGVAAVEQLEEVVLALVLAPRGADPRDGELGVVHLVGALAALAERAPVVADDRRVPEVAVHAVVPRRVGDRDVHVVHPRHCLGHHHLAHGAHAVTGEARGSRNLLRPHPGGISSLLQSLS